MPLTTIALSPLMAQLAEAGVQRSYRKGSVLIHEGDEGGTIYLVLKGRLRAFSATQDGGKEITFGEYGPGSTVGEMSLDGGPRSASVEAMEASLCSVVTRETLLKRISAQPELALEIMGSIIHRARLATSSAKSLALLDVYGRLSQLLLSKASPPTATGIRVIEERLTHAQIAAHIGASREMVSRILKDLERGGYISTEQRSIQLLKNLPQGW
jgi:CRP/FNR family transcriptional regulator, cyclic AMP receptor protein